MRRENKNSHVINGFNSGWATVVNNLDRRKVSNYFL